MSDLHTPCDRFEDWMLEEGDDTGADASFWHSHLASCSGCRRQWAAHQMLVAAFAEKTVPQLSAAFQAGLDRKLEATVQVEPLTGWRLAALAGYAVAAVGLMAWLLTRFPLPTISVDYSSPWTLLIALTAVPLTLWLTAAATRLLPSQRPTSARPLAL